MVFWYFRTMLWLDIRPSLELRATDTILQQQAPLGKCFLKWGQGCRSTTTRSVRRASGLLETVLLETSTEPPGRIGDSYKARRSFLPFQL